MNVLAEKLDALWRVAVKLRDGRCCICGAWDAALEAHHSIIRRSSIATRWAMNNGLTLCWKCHAHVHSGGLKSALQAAMDRVCSREDQDAIRRAGHMIFKPGQDWFENQVENIKNIIKSYKKES